MSDKKVYLGDAVYASFDGWGITLTNSDGIRDLDKIYLEPEVFAALNRFVDGIKKEYAK